MRPVQNLATTAGHISLGLKVRNFTWIPFRLRYYEVFSGSQAIGPALGFLSSSQVGRKSESCPSMGSPYVWHYGTAGFTE